MAPRIGITGAAGYIGSRLVATLQRHHPDWEIVACDDFSVGTVDQVGDVAVQQCDVRDDSAVRKTLKDVDAVAHLAAVSGIDSCADDPTRAQSINVAGTQTVLTHCQRENAGLVFPCTMAALGVPQSFPITENTPFAPESVYGRTKADAANIVADYATSIPTVTLLKANVYGDHLIDGRRVSKSTVVNYFVERAVAGEPLTVHEPGTQTRNYIHVSDVATLYVQALRHVLGTDAASHERVVVGGDDVASVSELANIVATQAKSVLGRDVSVTAVENPRPNDVVVTDFAVDTTKARELLHWDPPRSLAATIHYMLESRAAPSDVQALAG